LAGVHCEGECTDGKVRLRGTINHLIIGQVEVCVNGTWSTICNDYWDDNDASVICNQLGYSFHGAQAYSSVIFDDYPTRIYGVNCSGNEAKLFNCPIHITIQGISYSQCSASYAGVACQVLETPNGNCTTGEVRLVDGSSVSNGRVEVCINNMWGTICDDEWDTLDGNVICQQLGYQKFGSKPTYWSHYGTGSYPILLAGLGCTGSEATIADCNKNAHLLLQCQNSEVAGVECEEPCTDEEVRIVGSPDPSYGRVEVCVNQTWGTICDSSTWNNAAASVICSHQGFSPHGAIATRNGYSTSLIPTNIDIVNCIGSETSIFDCLLKYGGDDSVCDSLADAEVICQSEESIVFTNCTSGSLRLADVSTSEPTAGRIEICINGVWGTVCDNGWSITDANVACDQLGYYPSGATARYGAYYGEGSGPIFLSNLQCSGSELTLLDCPRDMYSVKNCSHYNDAGVKCLGSFPVYANPSIGHIFGGEQISITGPSFETQDNISCVFGDVETEGVFINERKCLCVAPPATSEDSVVELSIKITRGSATLSGATKYRYIIPFLTDTEYDVQISDEFAIYTETVVGVTWDHLQISNEISLTRARVNITMRLYIQPIN
jgi:hypothetical protein